VIRREKLEINSGDAKIFIQWRRLQTVPFTLANMTFSDLNQELVL
jgi:hypothetical protein